jgi:hypothetical protein
MAQIKLRAKLDRVPETGQPNVLFIMPDGMEARKTLLPKHKIRDKHNDKSKRIEQRIMGVEVVCGPIHNTFIFVCDDLAASQRRT